MTPEDIRKDREQGTYAAAEWPREIFAAEIKRDEHEMSGTYVLSEHGTLPRWKGDDERDRPWQCYVDKDIYDSAEKYWSERLAQLSARNAELATQAVKIAELKAERDQAVEEAQGSDEVLLQYVAQVKEHEATIAAQAAEMAELESALKKADELSRSVEFYGSGVPRPVWDLLTEYRLARAALKSEGE